METRNCNNEEARLRGERRAAARRAREAERRAAKWRALSYGLLVFFAVLLAVAATLDVRAEDTAPPALAETAEAPECGEDPQESEKIEAALVEQGFLSEAVPMSFDAQCILRAACEQYSVPYALALGVIETESGFDADAVGRIGEIGRMQLNPGPDGAYHKALQEATGFDPTTEAGNLVCGTYLLGLALERHGGDETAALMAYNMGEAGAKRAAKKGITSTDYTEKVLASKEKWED